jgi:hypothetical protein
VLLLAAAITLALSAAPSAFAQTNDQNCVDFPTQAAAQAHLRADPSDPDNLDADDDGLACELFSFGAAEAGGAPLGDDAAALPFTGPGDGQLPLGVALLGAGTVLVLTGRRRYQARHARR